MALSDYAHWNEDAERIWWEEEGRHVEDEPYDRYDDADDYIHSHRGDWEKAHNTPEECLEDGNFNRTGFTTTDGKAVWICSCCDDSADFVEVDGKIVLA